MSAIITIDTPYLTCDEYAKRVGLSKRAVQERAKNGEYPIKPRKTDNDTYFINNALLLKQALEANQ